MKILTEKIIIGHFLSKVAVFLLIIFLIAESCNSEKTDSLNEKEKDGSSEVKLPLKKPENQTTSLSNYSDITCPKCGFTKNEKMPKDVCLIKYACTKCNHEMVPDEDDCCVFCTYGTHKCPSMQ